MRYAGIGSRKTPKNILQLIESFSERIAPNATLLSGAAKGADQAFEFGATLGGGRIETFLPWPGFEGRLNATKVAPDSDAYEIAAFYHPNWSALKEGARKLIARDSYQVLGATLEDPVDLVVCYTSNESINGLEPKTGGTGQALRIASDYKIPVINLSRPNHLDILEEFVCGSG